MQAKQSILIIDDAPLEMRVLSQILSPLYEVKVARNGLAGLEAAQKYNIDLILLDVVMDGMSGFDVLKELKKFEKTKDIPVIFITSLDSSANEEHGLLLGAVDYITKPFVETIVKLRVQIHLKLISQMRTIERFSMIDSLTELNNRRSFDKQMAAEWNCAIRNNTYVSFLMIDIDKFKLFNDNYGHACGDVCLKVVAEAMQQSVKRGSDLVFRWGGEEFAVLLPDISLNGAIVVAERIRQKIESTPVSCSENQIVRVTISVGVGTMLPKQEDKSEDFCVMVDRALYQAKENGRNRVKICVENK